MLVKHIFTYFIVALSIQIGCLSLLLFIINKIFKRAIEEVSIGIDDIFFFYIKNVKVNVGFTFFFVVGLKPKEHEDINIRDKEFKLFSILNTTVKGFLLIAVLALGGVSISALFYYLVYFCCIMDLRQLKIGLQHFNGFDLAVGILELAIIFDILGQLIIRFIAESKIKQVIFLVNSGLAVLLYLRLVCCYIFN